MKRDFLTIGIGASAGSLQVIIDFFKQIQPDMNAAFVVVTHLLRDRRSQLDTILSRHAHIPVVRVESDTALSAGHIYVMVENTFLTSENHILRVKPRSTEVVNKAVDVFLSSLATDAGESAVALILSGGGKDGLTGCQAIHDHGGKVFVQDPGTANVTGMPEAVIEFDHPHMVGDINTLATEINKLDITVE